MEVQEVVMARELDLAETAPTCTSPRPRSAGSSNCRSGHTDHPTVTT